MQVELEIGHHLNVNGKLEFEGDKVICGIKAWNPACFPAIISASITCFWKEWHINLVSLYRPGGWILCNNIIGEPTLMTVYEVEDLQ